MVLNLSIGFALEEFLSQGRWREIFETRYHFNFSELSSLEPTQPFGFHLHKLIEGRYGISVAETSLDDLSARLDTAD